jgi:hypothetical protein
MTSEQDIATAGPRRDLLQQLDRHRASVHPCGNARGGAKAREEVQDHVTA